MIVFWVCCCLLPLAPCERSRIAQIGALRRSPSSFRCCWLQNMAAQLTSCRLARPMSFRTAHLRGAAGRTRWECTSVVRRHAASVLREISLARLQHHLHMTCKTPAVSRAKHAPTFTTLIRYAAVHRAMQHYRNACKIASWRAAACWHFVCHRTSASMAQSATTAAAPTTAWPSSGSYSKERAPAGGE
jgi:hypothetical protein